MENNEEIKNEETLEEMEPVTEVDTSIAGDPVCDERETVDVTVNPDHYKRTAVAVGVGTLVAIAVFEPIKKGVKFVTNFVKSKWENHKAKKAAKANNK